MNKNDVYRLIGYHGEYNTNVKKALRKLLKENHPDNKGDRKKFELINEVKKELESDRALYVEKEIVNKNSNIDYKYCYQMIDELKIKKNNLNELISTKKELLNDCEKEYKDLYQESLDLENKLLINSPYVKKVQNIKILSILSLVLMILAFIISIIENSNLFFIIFISLSAICIYIIQKYLYLVHKITESNKRKFTNYVKLNNMLKKNVKKQNSIKKEIRDIKRKMVNVENDLRFYKNLLK